MDGFASSTCGLGGGGVWLVENRQDLMSGKRETFGLRVVSVLSLRSCMVILVLNSE